MGNTPIITGTDLNKVINFFLKMMIKKGNAVIIVIIVLVITSVGLSAWVYKLKSKIIAIETPSEIDQNSIRKDQIVEDQNVIELPKEETNLNTYTNKRYGYTISYPSNWFVDTSYSEEPIIKRGMEFNPDFIGGDTTWSNYEGSFDLGTAPKDYQSVHLLIEKDDKAKSLDDFVKNFDFTIKENITINGIPAFRMHGNSKNVEMPISSKMIVLMKDGLFYRFSDGIGQKNVGSKEVLEMIASTLKF